MELERTEEDRVERVRVLLAGEDTGVDEGLYAVELVPGVELALELMPDEEMELLLVPTGRVRVLEAIADEVGVVPEIAELLEEDPGRPVVLDETVIVVLGNGPGGVYGIEVLTDSVRVIMTVVGIVTMVVSVVTCETVLLLFQRPVDEE